MKKEDDGRPTHLVHRRVEAPSPVEATVANREELACVSPIPEKAKQPFKRERQARAEEDDARKL